MKHFAVVAIILIAAATMALAQPWRRPRNVPNTQPTTAPSAEAAPRAGAGAGFRAGRGPMGVAGPGGEMGAIHSLPTAHQRIHRTVEEIPGGVLTVTTSDDDSVTSMLRTHVAQMKQRMTDGRPIRMWDPLFVELFVHREKVILAFEDVPGGVKAVATSEDPRLTQLIRQHAIAGVSEFVGGGWNRAHQPTTLPAGYVPDR